MKLSIARRLALMFAAATVFVYACGAVLLQRSLAKALEHQQHQELEVRFAFLGHSLERKDQHDDWAKVRSKLDALTPVEEASLGHEIERTTDYLDFVLEEKEINIEIRGDVQARIEKRLFHRALVNLIHNAALYAAPRSTIVVEVTRQSTLNMVSVSNPGEPIEPTQLAHVFERFYRADTARINSDEHHGLGLAIVKAVALMHGGNVFAVSANGVNTFGITLAD